MTWSQVGALSAAILGRDAHNGIANAYSGVMLHTQNIFLRHDFEIPFPQRDLQLHSVARNLNLAESMS